MVPDTDNVTRLSRPSCSLLKAIVPVDPQPSDLFSGRRRAAAAGLPLNSAPKDVSLACRGISMSEDHKSAGDMVVAPRQASLFDTSKTNASVDTQGESHSRRSFCPALEATRVNSCQRIVCLAVMSGWLFVMRNWQLASCNVTQASSSVAGETCVCTLSTAITYA